MSLSEIGAIFDVIPTEEYATSLAKHRWKSTFDQSRLSFKIERLYFEEEELHAVSGCILPGHDRFSGLTCFAIKRLVSNWEIDEEARAMVKIGCGTLVRDKALRFNHPNGTTIVDADLSVAYPTYCTFAFLVREGKECVKYRFRERDRHD